jgi:protein TonB
MARNNTYFIISGFISFLLFALVAITFSIVLFSKQNSKMYALKKDTYVSVSLVNVPKETKKSNKKIIKPIEKESPAVEEKVVDIGELFSDVWTKDINLEKKQVKKVNNKRLELIRKKIKPTKNKTTKKTQESSDTLAKSLADKNIKSSTGDEVNEYLAKIQAIVYKHFYPPSNSEGHTVKAVIELSALGKVIDFRILTYSSNAALNDECNKIRDRLLGVLFPINPQNKSSTTIVNITSDKN